MGSLFSRIRLIYQTLKSISDSFSLLSERISHDPGLPGPNPSRSYWCQPPSPLDARPNSTLPDHADVVIIGSGIAGTAIARTLLESQSGSDTDKKPPLRVVMLEARDVCSGATGRNGGHISPNTYQDYSELAARYGASAAQTIIRFRLAHLTALLAVAEEEHLLGESQARVVEQFDAYLHEKLYQRAKDALEGYLTVLPERRGKHNVHDDKSTVKDLQLSSRVTGCISQQGGALHPYRLITGILARLVATYPSFHLFTHTPCKSVTLAADGHSYLIETPKGTLRTTHVVHATNAWAAHLLPGMRRKIVPIRAHMTAQRPGRGLGQSVPWAGTRAFVFYPGTSMFAFDYLTQHPPPPTDNVDGKDSSESSQTSAPAYPSPAGELMFGGGAMLGGRAEAAMMDNIGVADDSETDFEVTAYLGGALERYFEPGWGQEGARSATATATATRTNEDNLDADREWGGGRMKAAWSGILGLSADGQPWIGRVPRCVSGREEPKAKTESAHSSKAVNDNLSLASPGEWIAAGFTGEGMTHAWLSGVALARMVLGETGAAARDGPTPDAAALPSQFLITEKRWKEADIEAFLGDVGFE